MSADNERESCNGICLSASDIGVSVYPDVIAYAHPECQLHGDARTAIVTARWYSDEEYWLFDTGDDLADHDPSDHQFVVAVPKEMWRRREAALAALNSTYDELVSEFGLATDGPWFDSPCAAFVEGRPFEPSEIVNPEYVASIRRWMNCKSCGRPRVYHDGEVETS